MRFLAIATICLGLASGLGLAQIAGKPAAPPVQSGTAMPPPNPQPTKASPAEPQEISHEEMVKEQERRDREAEEERDRDDQ